LPYIIAIATYGNLSAASKNLGVSQPALSKYLNGLEKKIGMDLFFRYKKNLYPTPAGKLYIKAAREILDIIEQTHRVFEILDEPSSETVHFGTSPHRGANLIFHIFPEFNRRFPKVELIAHEHYAPALKRLLLEKKISVAITTDNDELPKGLKSIPIHYEEIIMAVPVFHHQAPQVQSFILEELSYVDLSDFQDSVFIMPNNETGLYSTIKPLFQKIGFIPKVPLSSPNVMTEIAMIRAGRGIGLIPSHHIHKKIKELAFYRLREPAYMISSIIIRGNHKLTETERFLIHLAIKHMIKIDGIQVKWNSFLAELIWEFDPVEARAQQLEEWL